MALTAEYSHVTWDTFFQPTFAVYPELESQLQAEFITYKSTGAPSNLLGRDAPFDYPPFAVDANVQHIHVNLHFQLTFNGSSNVTPFQKIASMRASTPTILLTCYLNVLLSSYQIQTVARRSQARLAAAIVLLGGGDAGMTHRILHRNQVFPIIQHGRGKSTP